MSDVTSTAGGETPTNSTPVTGTSATGETPGGNKPRFTTIEEAHKEYERLEAKYREEGKTAAERRIKLKEYEDKLKTFENAQLSEAEKKDKALGELQQTNSQLQERYQRLLVKQSVLEAAPDMGIKGKLAAALLDWSSLKIDDEGNVTNLKEALKALLEEYPDIAAQQPSNQPQTTQQRQQVPPSNPQRSSGNGLSGQSPRNISWSEAFKKQ